MGEASSNGWRDDAIASGADYVQSLRLLDRAAHVAFARATLGLSPASRSLAFQDWFAHLLFAPSAQVDAVLYLASHWARSPADLLRAYGGTLPPYEGLESMKAESRDRRFEDPRWQQFPFNWIAWNFLHQQAWWERLTNGVPGVSRHHADLVSFTARQVLDVFSPSNVPWTNPEFISETLERSGLNLVDGLRTWMADAQRIFLGLPPAGTEAFIPGQQVAITPGKVVFRNRLIELIQYGATTSRVDAEPLLIVPAWIMKYYILDLSPRNSMVRYLVERGHTVFMISWKNPTAEDRDLGIDDYLELGLFAALAAIRTIVPGYPVHAVGYCLGGTLLAIGAAILAARGDRALSTLTLLAAQTDFTEPGELSLFIDESQISLLEDLMWSQGYLDGAQMAGAFQMLRSTDLIWSRMTRSYLLGKRDLPNDLMSWNADVTRMPSRMHSEYLRGTYLRNDLAEGHMTYRGQAVSMENVRYPLFVVATEADHVAPWRSVYKIHLLTDTDTTFVLTSGGHNAGIVSEPGHPRRHYHWAHHALGETYTHPDDWMASAQPEQGSWWPRWSAWLHAHSTRDVDPPPMGAGSTPLLMDAPGNYVLQR